MTIIRDLTIIVLVLGVSLPVYADIDLSKAIVCEFGYYQYLDPTSHKSKNHKPLKWSFTKLGSNEASFLSGVDTGKVISFFHETSNGVSVFLPQGNGAHLFSIWRSGIAYWSKHNDIVGQTASQQFRGKCTNEST